MRHLTAVASLAATLTLLISTPAQARTTMHAGGHFVADHHRAVVSSRFALIADTRFGNRSVSLDRFPRRFSAGPQHRFAGFDRFGPFSPFNPFNEFAGFDGFGGWDWGPGGWADYGSAAASVEPPAEEIGALPTPAPRSPAELPRCHEATSVGVVIERGVGCAH